MEEFKRNPGSSSGPDQSLPRSSSRKKSSGGFKRSMRRMLRSTSLAFRHSRSIKPAEAPAPSPAVNPDPTDGAGAGAGAGRGRDGNAGTRRGDGAAGIGSNKTRIETSNETRKEKDSTKGKSGWTVLFRPVTGLVKAYINFMMRPTPDEDGYTPGSHLAMGGSNPTLGGNASRTPSAPPSPRPTGSRAATPGSASSRSANPAAYRPTQSGPIPARHRQRHASVRRYAHSGPLPGADAHDRSHLVHSDSRRYSGELRKDGELLKRRTPEEVERDAVVGQAVVFGPGKPTPPPKPQVVEEEEEEIVFAVPPLPSSSYAPRLFAVAEEAGTPRGITLR